MEKKGKKRNTVGTKDFFLNNLIFYFKWRERERGKVSNKEYTKFRFEIQFFGLLTLIFFCSCWGSEREIFQLLPMGDYEF